MDERNDGTSGSKGDVRGAYGARAFLLVPKGWQSGLRLRLKLKQKCITNYNGDVTVLWKYDILHMMSR